ncbi:MAG: hypothetical protein JG765_2622 [Cereibacter sp.]|jgi:hypothetical protein|nr:hypothetical protein [Cereibacter sp.]
MSLSPARRSFANRYSDASDKILLGGAFLLGIAGSIGLKIADLPTYVPALFSAVVIILYAAITYYSRSARLEPDQIGDNAYYLGFVLTLSSLSYTLYELGSQDAESVFIAQVISGFGVALSSTIVGVATRVLLIQFRVDLVARDREAKLTLNDAMRSFRSEMADAIRGTKYLGAEIRQSLEEHHDAIAASQEARLSEAMLAMVASFQASLGGLLAEAQATQKALLENGRSTVSTAERHAIHTLNRLEASLQQAADRISTGTLALAKVTEDGITANREAFAQQFAATTAMQEAANRGIVTSAENLSKLVSSVLGKAAAEAGREMQTARSDVAQTSGLLKEALGALTMDVAAFTKLVKAQNSALARAQTAQEGADRRQDERVIQALGTMISAMEEITKAARVMSAPAATIPMARQETNSTGEVIAPPQGGEPAPTAGLGIRI